MQFESIIQRSLNLLYIQQRVDTLFVSKDMHVDISDMTRASIVLAVSAMDAYFTDVFAERLVPFLKKKKASKELVAFLHQAGLDTGKALQLLGMKRPFRCIRTLIDSYLEKRTTHRIAAINDLFVLYGLNQFCQNIEGRSKKKTLLKSIETLVRRRHSIAHKGDLNAHGRLKPLASKETSRRILDIVKFVSCADEILQNQMST